MTVPVDSQSIVEGSRLLHQICDDRFHRRRRLLQRRRHHRLPRTHRRLNRLHQILETSLPLGAAASNAAAAADAGRRGGEQGSSASAAVVTAANVLQLEMGYKNEGKEEDIQSHVDTSLFLSRNCKVVRFLFVFSSSFVKLLRRG